MRSFPGRAMVVWCGGRGVDLDCGWTWEAVRCGVCVMYCVGRLIAGDGCVVGVAELSESWERESRHGKNVCGVLYVVARVIGCRSGLAWQNYYVARKKLCGRD